MKERKNIAGLSMKGGKKDQFFLSLLEYFPNEKRWFLRSLLRVKEDSVHDDGDSAILDWIKEFDINHLVIDFPLSSPTELSLDLGWPKANTEQLKDVQKVNDMITALLDEDQKMLVSHPKNYEKNRNQDDEINFSKNIFDKETIEHILSRSFKRRLKKGFIPYWNRVLDFWIWCNYYDQLLKTFNVSYDSFGNTGLMVLFRFNYLRKRFPKELELFEANSHILLLELLKNKLILKKDLVNLSDLEEGVEAKLNIIEQIEKHLQVFIYDKDIDTLLKNPRAFESFLLAIAGQFRLLGSTVQLPDWTHPEVTNFVIPDFQNLQEK